tara:strand:+ start:1183 stop:1347 length:165 start_codon:yes stop_codon:yes gene_type:complete
LGGGVSTPSIVIVLPCPAKYHRLIFRGAEARCKMERRKEKIYFEFLYLNISIKR